MPQLGEFLRYVVDNKQWIFSGVGVLVLTGAAALLRRLFFLPKQPAVHPGPTAPTNSNRAARNDHRAVPTHWQGIIPDRSNYEIVTDLSDSISLERQTFSFEYGLSGHAKPLSLQGRTPVQANLQFTCHIVNPYKAAFGANEYALNILQPRFLTAAREILERYSLTELRSSRDRVAIEILNKVLAGFDEFGVCLDGVSIGSLEKLR